MIYINAKNELKKSLAHDKIIDFGSFFNFYYILHNVSL